MGAVLAMSTISDSASELNSRQALPATPAPDDISTLVQLLRWRAAQQPTQRIYTFLADGETEDAQLTYGELDRQAHQIGAHLQQLGLAGEQVLLFYPPNIDYIAALFGCFYAGLIAVPAYPPRLNRPAGPHPGYSGKVPFGEGYLRCWINQYYFRYPKGEQLCFIQDLT